MGNIHNNQSIDKFTNKEFTKNDLDDVRKYHQESITNVINRSSDIHSSKQVFLIKEVVDMVKRCDMSTMELKSITPGGYDTIIYRKIRGNSIPDTKYEISWPNRDASDLIRVIKDGQYEYHFNSINTMRGHFHLQDQIDTLMVIYPFLLEKIDNIESLHLTSDKYNTVMV
jgi:hypothetical protein